MSIISARLKELEDKFISATEYVDLNVFGVYHSTQTNNWEIAVHRDFALTNSVKMWMLSKTGDYYREPTKGGIIDLLLGSSMSEEHTNSLRRDIMKRFEDNFTLIELVDLDLEPDPVSKIWKVKFKILDVINKRIAEFSLGLEV